MELNLKGKVALVTGGSRGLGRAICLSLAHEGANVAVNYHSSQQRAAEVVEEINASGSAEAWAVAGNVSREADVAEMFRQTLERFGQLDILVNNAGICPVSYVKDMPAEMWLNTIGINLTGTFFASREMTRYLTGAERTGCIVNIASQAAFNGSGTGKAHYSASKAGVVALTVSLAKELAPHGIRVNAVAPGMMHTDMVAETLKVNEERYNKMIPLGRVGDTREIADVVAFLASDKSSYMTGATVDVSGGMLMR